MSKVAIELSHCQYEVIVELGIRQELAQHLNEVELGGRKCALISDENVAGHYLTETLTQLESAGYAVSSHVITAGEASKSMGQATELCREMIQEGHDRKSFVLALGGGVVGDLAGFVASIFYRGVPFVQIPTTIVSQVDSSVGGKTGVNVPEGKNLIGAFHQPELVLIDPEMLKTLPDREYREGYAEVIKHSCIRDAAMMADLEALDLTQLPPPSDLLARNIAIKARVVEQDEKETAGTRALLNFGHTIGHGIEASVPYGQLLHGEAISLGMRAALWLSVKHSTLSQQDADRVIALLEQYQLPVQLQPEIETTTILDKMKTDKKFSAGQIKFVLLTQLGDAIVASNLSLQDLEEAIEEIRRPLK